MEAVVLDDAFERELESELRMVREAVLLLRPAGAGRVVVANLHHGRVILEPARRFASELGLGVEALATDDPRRIDIAAMPSSAGIDGQRA